MAGNERVTTCISKKELERRWGAVRREMEARDIDALVMQNASDWLGGYVKWFTDVPGHNHYPRTVIFHRDDLMTVIEMGAAERRLQVNGEDALNPGVGEFAFTPSFFSISYTHEYDGVLAADELKRRGCKTVGWIGKGALPVALVNPVEQRLSGVKFVDATEFIDVLKAIKSPEEIALIRQAAAMQDKVFAKVLGKIAPGIRDSDLSAFAQYEGELMESEQGVFRGSSAPLGKPAILRGRHFQGRVMGRGDYITLLIENNGPGGYYTELARTMVLGKASAELLDGFAAVKEAQEHTVRKLKAGASCAEIYAAHNAFMTSRGLPPERRLYCHGQGYDMVERPLVRNDEPMAIAPDMCIAVHPGITTPSLFVFLCDNFLLHADGTVEHLHGSEQKVFEV